MIAALFVGTGRLKLYEFGTVFVSCSFQSRDILRLFESSIKSFAFYAVFPLTVPKRGLEPPSPYEDYDLNVARLPISPLRHSKNERRE